MGSCCISPAAFVSHGEDVETRPKNKLDGYGRLGKILMLYNIIVGSLLSGGSCQLLPTLVDTVPVFRPTSTNMATYIQTSSNGDSNVYGGFSLDHPYQEVFVNIVFSPYRQSQDFRIYDRFGVPMLSFSSGGAGIEVGFVKSYAGTNFGISSVKWSPSQTNYASIQQFSVLNGEFSTSGPIIPMNIYRMPRVLDDPDTLYFIGLSLDQFLKFSVTDGQMLSASNPFVGPFDYSRFLFRVSDYDVVVGWFVSDNTLAVVSRSNLATIGSKPNMQDVPDGRCIQSKLDSKTMWNAKQISNTGQINIQRRQATADANLLVTMATSGTVLPFWQAYLAQMASVELILVVPQHSNSQTPANQRGVIYFARAQELEIYSYNTPGSWNAMTAANVVMNTDTEDGGRRFYTMIGDATSDSLHTYYLLIDKCMKLDDLSLNCTECPIGYWRASAVFPVPRRCAAPSSFPPLSGMKNSTMEFEPCAVSGCTQCTFDSSSCAACDTQNGFFLFTRPQNNECLRKSQFPDHFGLDATGALAVACEDANCLDCRDDFGICIRCDTASNFYLRNDVCISTLAMNRGEGPNLVKGTVEPCKAPGCLGCRSDFLKCENCDQYMSWFLDQNTSLCVRLQEFTTTQGRDNQLGTVMQCKDQACTNCKDDYRICSECSKGQHFLYEGECREFGGALSPNIKELKSVRQENSIRILFQRPTKLVYAGDFFSNFVLLIKDQVDSKTYTCSNPSEGQENITCSVVANDIGFSISLKALTKITKGTVIFYPHPVPVSKTQALILDRSSNQAFNSYPIVVEDFSTDTPYLVEFTMSLVDTSSWINSYLSLVVATVSLSASVIFDKYMVTLEYLSLLEGPLLVYPQQIFERVGRISNYLPAEVLPEEDKMQMFGELSECTPSSAFLRLEYECSVFANFGPDALAFMILAATCALITVVCNKIIDMRIRVLSEQSRLPASAAPNLQQKEVSRSSEIMHKSNSMSGVCLTTKPTEQIENSSPQQTAPLEKRTAQESFLPSGKIDPSKFSASRIILMVCTGVRETYGLSFLFVKLEATQFKLMVVVFLNYWNYNQGNLEQYSLIAAIIFTLYYIFQGYFTYQFAVKLWEEMAKKNLEPEATPVVSDKPTKGQVTSNRLLQRVPLSELAPQYFEGPIRDLRCHLYSDICAPTHFWQLCRPLVEFLRAVTIAALSVMLSSAPSVQVIFAIIVEIAYLVFIIKGPSFRSRTSFCLTVWSHSLLVIYMGMKGITIALAESEEDRQRVFGWWMSLILATFACTGMVEFLHVVCNLLYTKLKSCRKRKSNQSNQIKPAAGQPRVDQVQPPPSSSRAMLQPSLSTEMKTTSDQTKQVQEPNLAKTLPAILKAGSALPELGGKRNVVLSRQAMQASEILQ